MNRILIKNAKIVNEGAIFEGDVLCNTAISDNCGLETIQQVMSSTEDLFYVGWCKDDIEEAPHCTHAYSLSIKGALILDKLVHLCHSIDIQIYDIMINNKITWAYAKLPSNVSYSGMTGLFIQPR
jgi:hypothetical protein